MGLPLPSTFPDHFAVGCPVPPGLLHLVLINEPLMATLHSDSLVRCLLAQHALALTTAIDHPDLMPFVRASGNRNGRKPRYVSSGRIIHADVG